MNETKKVGPFSEAIANLRKMAAYDKNNIPDVSVSTIQKIENKNHVPRAEVIARIWKTLGDGTEKGYKDLLALADSQRKQCARIAQSSTFDMAGVCRANIGTSRVDAFRDLSFRAQNRLIIMGIGMTNISKYALVSLEKLAARVPIDLLMIDPEMLESDARFAAKLEDFLGMSAFAQSVRTSFGILHAFSKEWNEKPHTKNKVQFRVYDTIPTMSMVMIDPNDIHGEMELEFFIYQAGEFRPRFAIKKVGNKNGLFEIVKEKYETLWKHSKKII